MKLLVVVPALGPVYGGPSKSVIQLAQALGKLGVSVDVITTNANGNRTADVPLHQWIQQDGYRVRYFPYFGASTPMISLSMSWWLLQHSKRYDLVQTNTIFSLTNLPAYLTCRWYRIPHVIIPRGMLEPWALSYKAWKKRLFYTLLEQPALQHASAVQMLASKEAEKIEPLGLSSPLIISPNGIHRQDFENLPSPDLFYSCFPKTQNKKLILFLGRIDPKKGLDLLAPAFDQVRLQFPEAHLIVAGPDNIGLLPTVKRYFSDLGAEEDVTFTGMIEGALKASALAAADIYVSPSYSEGFSMSVLEGMASGLSCVITTGCNFPEAGTASAAHVVDANVAAITDALYCCLAEPQSASAMGRRAREFILEEYTWDSIASKLLQTYQLVAV